MAVEGINAPASPTSRAPT